MKLDGFTIGMIVAMAAAIIAPGIGADSGPLPLGPVITLGVALIFFLHGAKLSGAAIRAGFANWRIQLPILGTTFVLFPIVGAIVYFGMADLLTPDLALGFFFLCAVSSTVSTSVAMTALARGNVAAAVLAAASSGLLGVMLTPFLLALVAAAGGADLPLGPAIRGVILQLLVPFAIGHVLAFAVRPVIQRFKPVADWADRGVILLIVYVAFCNLIVGGAWAAIPPGALVLATMLVIALLALALAGTVFIARAGGFSRTDEATIVFCGSQKSLANGAPIAKIVFGASPALGAIMLPLILYHQLQLVVCGVLARRYAAREEAVLAPGAPAAPPKGES